jgi:hydrogenase nickel incorporation protein HypA/HybF
MHEVGLMQETMRLVMEQARAAGAARIHAVRLKVGALSGVECEALKLAFDVVSAGTGAEQAALLVESVPVRCWCAACERLFQPIDAVFRCPGCQQLSCDVREGREFDLISVEVS